MVDCIFCSMIEGKISVYKVYEDSDNLAFLDANPVNSGHVLLIPKKHVPDLTDLDEEATKSLFYAIKQVIGKIEKTISQHYSIRINRGQYGGQVVFHLHVHIIPRFEDDGVPHWPRKQLSEEQMVTIANKLREA